MSELRLESGPGPTMRHAFKDPRCFAMVIQLSFLGWTHRQESLAAALHRAMLERQRLTITAVSSPPSIEDLSKTLAACNAQSCSFAWDNYTQIVDSKLRLSIKDYYYCSEYMALTPAILLGALDYFYIIQKLPEHRKAVINRGTGLITLIIWAHFILGLNVLVSTSSSDAALFGDQGQIHITIFFKGPTRTNIMESIYIDEGISRKPEIQLFNEEMSVLLESSPTAGQLTRIEAADRFMLRGVGNVRLYRSLNDDIITPLEDPICAESRALIIALAARASQAIEYDITWEALSGAKMVEANSMHLPSCLEIWRVLAAAEVVFDYVNTKTDLAVIESYIQFLADGPLKQESLPASCSKFLKKIPLRPRRTPPALRYLSEVRHLATLVFLFAHVPEIRDCGSMPVHLYNSLETQSLIYSLSTEPQSRVTLKSTTNFRDLRDVLSTARRPDTNAAFLYSDFGWSIFLDTIEDRDPGLVRRDLVHIRNGIPTSPETNEQKKCLIDGPLQSHTLTPTKVRITPVRDFTPRTTATIIRRHEYWSMQAQAFELLIHLKVKLSDEWLSIVREGTSSTFEDTMGCSEMHKLLWQTLATSPCEHQPNADTIPSTAKLGPDVAIALGWNLPPNDEEYPHRVMIFLTRNSPGVRWLAIKQAIRCARDPTFREGATREILLRGDDCCDACAIEQAASLESRTILIL